MHAEIGKESYRCTFRVGCHLSRGRNSAESPIDPQPHSAEFYDLGMLNIRLLPFEDSVIPRVVAQLE